MLDEVNTVLAACNLPPVNTVSPPPSPAVSTIVSMIEQINRRKQLRGWWFNVDYEVELTPDSGGNIVLTDIVQVETRDYTKAYAIRDGRLYSLEDQSDVFSGPVTADVQRHIPFEETPLTWREYVAAQVAYLYSQQFRGNSGSTQPLGSEAAQAWVAVLQEDSRDLKRTVYDSPYTWKASRRYRGPRY